jgi:outer membrane protein assembly factor BamE (lipoprotein component of BamABCDE complex)
MKKVLVGFVVAAGMTACSVAGSTGSDPQVSQKAADAWPAKWCSLQPGATKEELVAIMGPPTDSSPTTMSWSAHQYQFNAFLDAKGTVGQLDINTHSLSAAEQAALKCEQVRTRATVARAAAKAAAKPARTFPAACALVTEAEMAAILGARVVAAARQGGSTECNYTPVSGISPAVKLSVDWGDGKIAMASAGLMSRREPGLTSPYDGIGDQAAAVGPALMIRTGEDLVTIVFTGVSGAPAKAKRIFDTAKARM